MSTSNNKHKSNIIKQNTSNEENELNNQDDEVDDDFSSRNASKKSKCETCCSNCTKEKASANGNKSSINENVKASEDVIQKPINPLISSLSNENRILITPIKPVGYANLDAILDADTTLGKQKNAELSSPFKTTTTTIASTQENQLKSSNIFAKNSNWTCSTCLVSNDESKSACVCCSTARPSTASETSKLNQQLSFDQVDANANSKPSLFASNTTAAAKWTCSTCLVSNDAQKDECACCMTKRANDTNGAAKKDEQETTKTKFASLVAAAGSFSNFNSGPLNTSISFGLKPSSTASSSNEPIKFGSSNGISSGFSFGATTTNTFSVSQDKPQNTLEKNSTSSISFDAAKNETLIDSEKTVKFGFLGSSTSNASNPTSSSTLSFNSAPAFNTSKFYISLNYSEFKTPTFFQTKI